MFFTVSFANAETYFSIASGNWTSRNTWSLTSGGGRVGNGVFPVAGDVVHIEGGFTVTLTTNAACATIDFSTGANSSLVLGTNTLNVSGNITIPRAPTLNTLNVGAGNLTAASIDFPTTGSAVRHKIIISTGTVTVSGSISTDSNSATSATIEFTGAGTLKVGGDFFASGGGALTQSTGTVELNGANQSFNSFTYYNLTLSGSGTKTFNSVDPTSVTNNLIINSGVNANLSTLTHTANKLTLGSTQALPSSWGSTTSNATNKSDVYFTATTGKINVTTSTCSTFSSVTPITNVSFNTLNKTTSASSTTGYENYTTDTPTTVFKTQYYPLTVKGNTGGDVNVYYTAFFDWNNDGDFDDADEYYIIGTIRNSSGTDAKITSVYVQIPSTAVTGTIKMRVIGRLTNYNTTPCAISGSTGQMEDYTVTIQGGCTETIATTNTLTSAASVCPNAPFTLSLGSTYGEAVTYLWETSPDGNAPWTAATTPSVDFFNSTFSTNQATNTTVGDIILVGPDTKINAGALELTDITETGHNGGFLINKANTANITPFTATFKYRIWDGGLGFTGADGMSLSYGSNLPANAGGGENGEGSGLIIQFDTYDNEAAITGSRVRVLYNNAILFNTAINAPFNLRTSVFRDVNLAVDTDGYLTLGIQNSSGTMITVVSKLLLPGYAAANKSTWKFKFSARTGGTKDKHSIDDLVITYLDSANSKAKFTTSETTKTYYRATITCGSSSVTSTPVLVDITSAAITPITASTCSSAAFTVTPVNGTNGTVPSGTTYSWPIPVVTGGLTGGAASTATSSSITGTLANPTTSAQTATYTVTPTTSGCAGATFTVTVTVNPLPTPTFTAQPATSPCIGTLVTYTTQGSMTNYIWGFPGTAGTNYTIVSGGTTADNTVTLRYLTAGSKTVTINYTNTNGCKAASATSSSAVTVNALPTPTFTAQPATSPCIGTSVTYTTDAGMTNYTWGFPGTAGTDYTIVSGGTTATNTVTLRYLTTGSKTVTINYTNTNGCTAASATSSSAVTVNALPTPTFTAQPATSPCIGTSVTYTTDAGMTNYTWGFPGTAGTNYTIVSGGTTVTNTVTLRYLTVGSKTVTINYTNINGCTAASATSSSAVTVNALPTPTFTAQPATSPCIGTSVTYTTDAGMTNYTWGFPGTAGTDYAIVSGGTTATNTVTLRYLTAGSKTVTINYTNTNGCTAASATSSSAVTVNALPTPTFTAQPASSTCIGTSVIYTTETGMTTYTWTFPGTAGTDYTIVSGGTTADNTVTLRYLTTGSKTVTINYTNTNGCTAASATSSSAVTVNALPVITTQPQPLTLCQGENGSFSVVTSATSPTYQWEYSTSTSGPWTVTNGAAGVSGHNTATLSLANVPANYSNYYVRSIVTSSTCNTISNAVLLTVNPLPTSPSVSTTNVDCASLGSVTLSNLPSSGTWTLERSPGAVITTGTGITTTITGLAAGTYTFKVSNGTCTSAASSDAVITDQSSTTWNGSSWSPVAPDATRAAIIAGPFTVGADLTVCSLTINSGINIVVPSDRTITIVNGLTVTTGSSLTFENHSSLVQINNNAVNSGKITYKRIAAQIRQADYVYWSTPVTPQRLIDVSPATPYVNFYGFNGTTWASAYPTGNMMVGKGYIIRGPNGYSNTAKADYQASFIGIPNNGIISGETMAAGKYYLIGNPYPSALDANTFITQNNFLEGTLYFWTHNTPVVLTGAYRYSSTDYASYNMTGGVGTGTQAASGNPSNNNNKPTGKIGAGQSFFAATATAGTISFNNGMRLGAADNTQFFKSASKTAAVERHRVWLNMTNAEGAFKQMLVGYVQGASNDYEARYDGVSFDANPYIDFYSVANGNNYVIQARALPFTNTDLVPLGYRTTIAGEFTIAIDEADGNLSTQVIYLEDKTTGTIHDLTAGNYKFTTTAGTFADRFVLRYTNKTLGTGDFENVENGLLISVKEKTIKVTSSTETIKEVTIYDISGKLLYSKKKVGTTELQIQNLQSSNQVLLVKVTLENNFTTTKKIIFN
ncbi:hypothetical protein AR687_12265 [Flavobacteriaceae bacterium CRH]|nr:hypothetical protein AR687_12265 [Flavobacteriaceae bacterium CRH]